MVAPKKGQKAPETAPEVKASKYPEQIKLLRPFGFIDDEGINRFWHAGQVIDDAGQVKLIVDRFGPWE